MVVMVSTGLVDVAPFVSMTEVGAIVHPMPAEVEDAEHVKLMVPVKVL